LQTLFKSLLISDSGPGWQTEKRAGGRAAAAVARTDGRGKNFKLLMKGLAAAAVAAQLPAAVSSAFCGRPVSKKKKKKREKN
jgi:uncharacterized protein (DUF2267 family)